MQPQSTRKIAPRRPVEPRACEACGTVFKPRDNSSPGRFCSLKCRDATDAMPSRPCEQCGTVFVPKKGAAGRFCSPPCYHAWCSRSIRGGAHPRWNRIESVCENCGAVLFLTPSDVANGARKYCSRACMNTYKANVPLADRFNCHVSRDSTPDACWLWTGGVSTRGYGKLTAQRRHLLAHRVAWELAADPIPKGTHVLHTCDNPLCVRNDDEGWYEVNGVLRPRRGHLVLGTHDDNMKDKVSKGRQSQGEAHFAAKVTEDQVREMRRRYERDNERIITLAHDYGLDRDNIRLIVTYRRWTHVPRESLD